MPMAALRPCRHRGCRNLSRTGWCEDHAAEGIRKAERRISAEYHAWYSKAIWTKRLRPEHLLIEPFCRTCAARGIRTQAEVVDHIQPFRGSWELFVDQANLQSLCKSCHDAKTMREQMASRRE